MSYEEWLPLQLPAWYQGENGGTALWAGVGALIDALTDQAKQSVRAGFPTEGSIDRSTTPPTEGPPAADALAATGFDRQLPQGVGESLANYAERLKHAWDAWGNGANPYGMLRALELAGYGRPILVQDNGRWARITGSSGTISDLTVGALMICKNRSNHPGWTFDIRTDFWARGAVIFEADATNLQTAAGQHALNATVAHWKPSNMTLVCSFVILSGRVLGWPTGRVLGGGEMLGGNSVRVIPGDGSAAFVVGP